MASEIEKLWESARESEQEQQINGALLVQSTFICCNCGHAKDDQFRCSECDHPGNTNA